MTDPRSFARIILLALFVTLPLHAQWTAPPDSALRAMLTDRIAREGSVGLVLGVIENGAPRLAAAGTRDGAGTAPVDGGTFFEIGSISKVFTGTLLADMILRGEVALDDPAQQYLPDDVTLPTFQDEPITLRHLATATSGLPSIPPIDQLDPVDPYASFTAEKLYAFLNSTTLMRAPGTQYVYSNLGMGLLGHLLARRAGKSYEMLVTERILAPLGMTETFITLPDSLQHRMAEGHGHDLDPTAPWHFDVLAPAGGWRSTPHDMLRFLAAAATPPTGPLGDALRLAMTPLQQAGAPNLRIGLAWHVLERGDRRIVWHNGETGGFHTMLAADPATGANALVLSNSAASIDDIPFHIVDPTFPLTVLPAPRPTIVVDEAVLARYVGEYTLAPGMVFDITREDDRLYAQLTGQPRFRLFATAPNRFFYKVVEAELVFTTNDAGLVTGLVLHQNGREAPAERRE